MIATSARSGNGWFADCSGASSHENGVGLQSGVKICRLVIAMDSSDLAFLAQHANTGAQRRQGVVEVAIIMRRGTPSPWPRRQFDAMNPHGEPQLQ